MDVSRTARARAWQLWVAVGCVGVLITGCGHGDATEPAGAGPTIGPIPAGPSPAEVFTACSPPGIVDYEPIESLAILAEDSTVVIAGEIDRIQAGRDTTYSAPNKASTTGSAVIVVRDVTVVYGELEPAVNGSVYIEFASSSPDECAGTVPPGTAVVAYLEPAWDGARRYVDEYLDQTSVYTEIEAPGAGRPAGQPLYQASALEGLVWQIPGSADVVWPLYLGTGPGAIREALPDGTLAGPE
ncbi:hypothetical protein E3T61_02310 [Cryobacterium lactosi]|uniref:Uncharacterized protein n=1 Tax=Cryobacterium lactosi TaxID=1259202 RepID=A0A4R9BXP1_9MICO|nr:hypothetical protein [Cryobacterium lactosi]TFD93863.1 hypothetical protein E3T61_02310 [Cryobacterium lactosi]